MIGKLSSSDGELPFWMNKKLLSELSRSSIQTTNEIINKFTEAGLLNLDSRPWKLNSSILKDDNSVVI